MNNPLYFMSSDKDQQGVDRICKYFTPRISIEELDKGIG